uniref:DUF4013 domain-containing protein n=1 Tax=Chromera velia CCMP2878 TaxID=1169474 RepID=A0A0G4HG11_9ALVE|eukprot:Cvel_27078.t1-p1 / transcript=Cvel_27078.t1 / gene=Cvel_27078 / organism=Chromera_velia_CCMP2878 / gene_product=hypothetical protein / transcript_product=hypothetical protein / location=Cvel_scaffold3316:11258-12079(-) / protein_length=274 / sequence_SO=supercontig / SO=protein_coding / is_pseudo=false
MQAWRAFRLRPWQFIGTVVLLFLLEIVVNLGLTFNPPGAPFAWTLTAAILLVIMGPVLFCCLGCFTYATLVCVELKEDANGKARVDAVPYCRFFWSANAFSLRMVTLWFFNYFPYIILGFVRFGLVGVGTESDGGGRDGEPSTAQLTISIVMAVLGILAGLWMILLIFSIDFAVDRPDLSAWQCVVGSLKISVFNCCCNMFALIVYGILLIIAGLLCLIVGVFPAVALLGLSISVLYKDAVGIQGGARVILPDRDVHPEIPVTIGKKHDGYPAL